MEAWDCGRQRSYSFSYSTPLDCDAIINPAKMEKLLIDESNQTACTLFDSNSWSDYHDFTHFLDDHLFAENGC